MQGSSLYDEFDILLLGFWKVIGMGWGGVGWVGPGP